LVKKTVSSNSTSKKRSKSKTSKSKTTKSKKKEFSVLQHFLVPKARVLSEEEKKALLEQYGVSEEQLPKMFEDDPVAKALSAKKGNVVEFERDDGTGKYKYYRIVV